MIGKTVRRFFTDLGYVVHTPGAVFGVERLRETVEDTDWLPVAGAKNWTVFCRDLSIMDRPSELQAYLAARVHMFVLPGNATRVEIVDLLSTNLAEICALAVARQPNVYWLTAGGVVPYEWRLKQVARRRTQRRR